MACRSGGGVERGRRRLLGMAGHDASARLESTLTSLSPYLRYALNERVSLWGLVGAGTGALSLKHGDGAALRTRLSLGMGALGVRGTIPPASSREGLELAVRSDLLWVRTESDGVNASGRLAAARAGRTPAPTPAGGLSVVRARVRGHVVAAPRSGRTP